MWLMDLSKGRFHPHPRGLWLHRVQHRPCTCTIGHIRIGARSTITRRVQARRSRQPTQRAYAGGPLRVWFNIPEGVAIVGWMPIPDTQHLPIAEHYAGSNAELGNLFGNIETDVPSIFECIFEGDYSEIKRPG